MSKPSIVCTIGPATADPGSLKALLAAGMTVARLNGSHSTLDWHRETIALIREAAPQVPILLDVPGRKIRTVELAVEPAFHRGDRLTLTTDTAHDGAEKVPVNYPKLHEDLQPGNVVYADDGTLRFVVETVEGPDIVMVADCDGTLRSRKGINVPFVKLQTPMITDRDHAMVAFAKETGVDYIGISFVESAEHVGLIKELIGGDAPRVVAKIENVGGLANMHEILGAADAIMIDRGDLSVETEPEHVALHQKRILEAAREAGTPVIVATEMLHSMIASPLPTKAEISDITNAILDGGSATMLSGETAVGDWPVQAVETMRRVAAHALDFAHARACGDAAPTQAGIAHAMGDAIARICRELPITKVVAVTVSGYAARAIAAKRPAQPILVVSNKAETARALNLLPGATGIHADITFGKQSLDHIPACLRELWDRGLIDADDMILVTAVGYPKSGNRMNLIQTHVVGDLAETLKWPPQA